MANDTIILFNPTPAAITVNGQTIASGAIGSFTIADTTTDLYGFVCKGCIAAPGAMTNGTANVTDLLDNLTQLIEKGTSQLGKLARPLISAGTNAQALAGV